MESDAKWLDRMEREGYLTMDQRAHLFTLARRGAEADAEIERLRAALRDLLRLVDEDPEEDDPSPYLFDQICDRARAALGGSDE